MMGGKIKMKSTLRIILFIITVFSITACATSISIDDNPPVMRHEPHPGRSHFTDTPFACADIFLNKKADIRAYYQGEVYLRINNHSTVPTDAYQNYLVLSVESMKFFSHVVTTSLIARPSVNVPVETDAIYNNVIWYDDIDPRSMRDLRENYSNALIVEMTLQENEVGRSALKGLFTFEVKVIDPVDGVLIARFAHQGRGNWGIKQNVINPALNSFHDWLYYSANLMPLPNEKNKE